MYPCEPKAVAVSAAIGSTGSGRVDLLERSAGEPKAKDLLEIRAADDVFVGTRERVLDGDAGGASLGDALVEFGELPVGELVPGTWGSRAGGHELADLVEREADVAKEEDGADDAGRPG